MFGEGRAARVLLNINCLSLKSLPPSGGLRHDRPPGAGVGGGGTISNPRHATAPRVSARACCRPPTLLSLSPASQYRRRAGA